MANKKISELTKVASTNATDEFVLSRGGTNVSIEAQNLTMASASYALTASYAVSSSVEIKQEITSSFAQTAFSATSASLAQLALEAISSSYSVSSSLAQLALETISSSYAVSSSLSQLALETISSSYALTASHALNSTSVSSSYAVTASYAESTTVLSGSASTARDVLVAKISGSSVAPISALSSSASTSRNAIVASISGSSIALSASLTTTDQSISASVAALSASSSTRRDVMYSQLEFMNVSLSGSASAARNALSRDVSGSFTEVSASLTTTDQAISASVATLSGSASDARNNITNVLSSSYALTASYAVSSSVEIKQEISSSYAQTSTSASYALTASHALNVPATSSYAITASYAISSSVEVTKEITSSYAETASYAASTTVLSGSASDARNILVAKISGSSVAPIATLSGSLTTTDQAISSSVATLSGSASDARNVLATTVSASDAFLRTRIDGDYIELLQLELTVNNLSGSLTTTDQAISSSVATLSGSASTARTALSSSLTATEQQLSSSLAAVNANQNTLIVNNLNQAFVTLPAQITAKADTTYVDSQDTALSASLTTTDQAISSSVAALSGSASDARNAITNVLSSSYALTASYSITSSVEVKQEVTSSYAQTATSASYALTASYALSSSVEITKEVSSSYADTASYAVTSTTAINANDLIIGVKNTSGETLPKGTPVYSTGVTGENLNISAASASSAATMPAIGILSSTLSNNSSGQVILTGKITGVDTSGFTAGNNIYVAPTGGFTETKPGGDSTLIQNIAIVGKVNATEGELVVVGSGRSNDVPNLPTDYIFLGNGNTLEVPLADAITGSLPSGTVSGSVQVDITSTTGYATFSSSLQSTDQTISASVATLSGSASDARIALSSSLTATDQAISASVAALSGSAAAAIGTISFGDITYKNSNVKSFNQNYLGNAIGGKFEPGEYQKIVTIIPSGASQNYQVVGRMTAQSGGHTHTINFNAALRSETTTDLSWSVTYNEDYVSTKFIKPLLWTKETATAGFIFAFECVTNIYGNVTIDFDVIPRSANLLSNVTVNENRSSEQTTIDTGYTSNDFDKTYGIASTTTTFTDLDLTGITFPSASYALTSSHAVTASHALFTKLATSSSLATTASYALFTKLATSSSYSTTASYAESTTILSSSAAGARDKIISKISGSSTAPIATLSGSLTSTDQAISASVATLSGSASTARDIIVTKISGSSDAAIATVNSNLNALSAALFSQLSAKASTSYVDGEVSTLETADTTNSASLTVTDQALSSSIVALSGSAIEARKALKDDYSYKVSGSFAQYISRIDQTGIADTIHFVTHNTNTIEQNISIAANDYEMTVANAGKYELKSTTQWQRATGVQDNVSLWIQVNGVDVGFSTNSVNLTDNFVTPLYAQWILDLDAGDVVRIAWSTTEGSGSIVKLSAFTNPTRPMTPSVNTHLIKIGD